MATRSLLSRGRSVNTEPMSNTPFPNRLSCLLGSWSPLNHHCSREESSFSSEESSFNARREAAPRRAIAEIARVVVVRLRSGHIAPAHKQREGSLSKGARSIHTGPNAASSSQEVIKTSERREVALVAVASETDMHIVIPLSSCLCICAPLSIYNDNLTEYHVTLRNAA